MEAAKKQNLDAKKVTADKVLAVKDKGSKDTDADNRSSKCVSDNRNSKDPVTKIEVRTEPKNTQSTTKGTTEATKNTVEKSAYKTVYNQSQFSNIDKITATPNETKTQTKVIKLDKPKMLESKPENAVKTDIKIAKVEPAKTVANKPSVTNPSTTNSPKVATNAKASGGTPKGTTKPATTTTKDDDEIQPTPKKEILPAKPNEMKTNVKTTNEEPSKATVKEATKSVYDPLANKPTTTNPANKTGSKPCEVKKPLVKAAKLTPPIVKGPTKITSKPFTNTPKKEVKFRTAKIKKFNTKITKNVHKTVKSYKDPARSIRNRKDKNNEGDFDELSDHDILALLSSGIVLDECSGSD